MLEIVFAAAVELNEEWLAAERRYIDLSVEEPEEEEEEDNAD
jgi:hypothetical protein